MSHYVIPIVVLIILIYGVYKKRNIYEDFLDGAKEGMQLIYSIIPAILAMTFAINIFLKSNVISIPLLLLKPLIDVIPIEVIPMCILRPISGTASLSIMNDIFIKYGPDSYAGLLASTIQGSTDTTIYVLALYFGSVKITKSRYALGVGLFADLVGIIASIIVVSLFFK